MSDRKTDLAVAFLQSQPGAAADVLEQQPVEHVAQFLSEIPYPQAAIVLEKMLPQYISRIFHHIEPAVAAAFMSVMDASFVAAIMRYSEPKKNKSILKLLPEKTRLLCRLLLNYEEDTVGAWMTANMPVFPAECTILEARKRFRVENKVDIAVIHIVDRNRHLRGLLGIGALFSAAPSTLISTVMNTNFDIISGRTPLKSAAEHSVWNKSDTVALNNRNHEFVGVIRHVDLRQALTAASRMRGNTVASDPLSGIYEVYGKSLLALLNTFGEVANFRSNK